MDYILFIIGLVLGLGVFAALMYFVIKFVKYRPLGGEEPKIAGKERNIFIVLNAIVGLFTIMSSFGCVQVLHASMEPLEIVGLIFGSYFTGSGISILISSFIIYYYRPDLNIKQRKIARLFMYVAIPVSVIGIWILTDAFASHLTYPLWYGISFTKGFVNMNTDNDGGFVIKFYGIVIVTGAAISYFVSDHYFYKKYKKHGILDTLLLVAFPAGIIGGRLWYCLVLEPGTNIFDIRSGGMAIQGGALGGIVAGVAFMLIFRRYVNIRWAMDVIVPTILLAQALGRWGNFFNCEVHGMATNMSDWWFLPRIIANNMQLSSTAESLVGTDQIYVPLFLVEGITNLSGYFIIRYAIGKPLKKYLSLGDLSMCYVIWYGLTRVCLEGLRSGGYEYNQSFITAIVMIGVGAVGIVAFHVYDLIRAKKGLPPKNLDTI